MLAYDYPGNVRELRNVIERAVILSTLDVIGDDCIVLSGPSRTGAASAVPPSFFSIDVDGAGKPPDLEALERAYIARLLTFAGRQPHGRRTVARRLVPDDRQEDRRLRPGLAR